MNRVLSIEQSQTRDCGGQSVYVTKRLCISIVFTIGFFCIIGGYIFGKVANDGFHRKKIYTSMMALTNLSSKAEALVIKANSMSLKALKKYRQDILTQECKNHLHCFENECVNVTMHDYGKFAEFVSKLITVQVEILSKSVDELSNYVDTIR